MKMSFLQNSPIKIILILGFILVVMVSITTQDAQAAPGINCKSQTFISTAECKGLKKIYNVTNGDEWAKNSKWITNTTPCEWYGISCSNKRVTSLILTSNNLVGYIPKGIKTLD
ncbi:MAG: hypothetical protein N2D54_00455, partial [Chloroflexota bacterium]